MTVKKTLDFFARLNKRISELQPDGTKKVKENGWFSRGNKLLLNGFRRGDMFVLKKYSRTNSHQCYLITDIKDSGELEMTWRRYGESDE